MLFRSVVGAIVAIGFSYFSHPKTPEGRTTDQMKRLSKKSAELLGVMSEGVAGGYSQSKAGSWLEEARILAEEIPALRAQSLEAKRYARWSPLAEADNADHIYLRAVGLEHIVVQVRTVARILFDMAVEGEINSDPNRQIASLISSASYAISTNGEIADNSNFEIATLNIANELRHTCKTFAAELIGSAGRIDQDSLVKEFELVSIIQRIADSIDESSPALSEVAMPDEPAMQKVIQVSPIDQAENARQRIWKSVRKFLRR